MRMFDYATGDFLTDRAEIIDRLVIRAISFLTFASSDGTCLPVEQRPTARRVLSDFLGNNDFRASYTLPVLVKALWRADVVA